MPAAMSPTELYAYTKQYLFLHVELVASHASPNNLPEPLKWLWQQKLLRIGQPEEAEDTLLHEPKPAYAAATPDAAQQQYLSQAIYMPELSQVAVISMAYMVMDAEGNLELRAKAMVSRNERDLLLQLNQSLQSKRLNVRDLTLVAHNGRDFHIPMLARRMLATGITLPGVLQTRGRKPWEIPLQDTLELWRMTERRNYSSLVSVAASLQLPVHELLLQSNQERSLQVASVFHGADDLKTLVPAARERVALLAQVYLKLCQLPVLNTEQIKLL